jgi:hypothetical protein
MSNESDVDRGHRAAQLLEDPLFVEAIAGMRDSLLEEWQKSKLGATGEREALFHLWCAIDSFEAQFREIVNGGKIALDKVKRAEADRRQAQGMGQAVDEA